jgi:hypothetical protein
MAVFSAGEGGPFSASLNVDVSASYDAGITAEVDQRIRHMPGVINYCLMKAAQLKNSTGSSNFKIVVQADPRTMRPRCYVAPSNNQGIHEELSQAVLLKAALGMAGK